MLYNFFPAKKMDYLILKPILKKLENTIYIHKIFSTILKKKTMLSGMQVLMS